MLLKHIWYFYLTPEFTLSLLFDIVLLVGADMINHISILLYKRYLAAFKTILKR